MWRPADSNFLNKKQQWTQRTVTRTEQNACYRNYD